MNEAHQLLQSELLPGEKITWSGQPVPRLLAVSDGYIVPFSLLWCGFAIFWEVSAIKQGAPGFFALWGVPFVLMGLYLVFGRFVYKSYRKKHTYYVVTNKRVFVLTDGANKKIVAAFIDQIPTITKSIGGDGVGTLRFGNASPMDSVYGNSGLEFLTRTYTVVVPTFYDVAGADTVYQLINHTRRNQA